MMIQPVHVVPPSPTDCHHLGHGLIGGAIDKNELDGFGTAHSCPRQDAYVGAPDAAKRNAKPNCLTLRNPIDRLLLTDLLRRCREIHDVESEETDHHRRGHYRENASQKAGSAQVVDGDHSAPWTPRRSHAIRITMPEGV